MNPKKRIKKKYGDVEGKGNILKGLGQGYDLLKSINEGTEVQEKGGKNFASQLEDLVGKPGSGAGRAPVGPDREIYKEEEDKIDEWGNKIKEQDAIVNDVRKDIAQLGREAKLIGEKQDEIGVKVIQTHKMAVKTDDKLTQTRNKLHELLEKYKSADRFCIDVILLCICLGLIAVLYNIVKSKYFSGSSSSTTPTTSSSTTSKMFLYY